MAASAVTLTTLLLAAAASGPKWTPLNSVKAGSVNETTQAKPQPTAAPQPVQTPVPAPVASDPPATSPAEVVSPPPPVVAAVGGVPQPLEITCFGGGTANKATAVSGFSSGYASGIVGNHVWSGSGSSTTTIVGTRQQGFGDQVDIRLFGGDDRIRLPRTMLPPIHGGSDGWFKLKNVIADARSIHASAAINFMSNPKVYIDRVTGTISISGRAGDYSGQCQAIDASAPAKF